MKELKTYLKINTVQTVEKEEDMTKIKVKIDGKWEQDGHDVDVKLSIEGKTNDIDHIFEDHPFSGEEVKIVVGNGAQMKLELEEKTD